MPKNRENLVTIALLLEFYSKKNGSSGKLLPFFL